MLRNALPAWWTRFDSVTVNELAHAPVEDAHAFIRSPYLARLRRLQIVNSFVETEVWHAIIDGAGPLDHLGLCVGPYSPQIDGASLVPRLAANRALHGLRSVFLSELAIASLEPLGCLRGLEALALYRSELPLEAICALGPALPALATLELDLAGGELPATGLTALVSAFPALRRLRICNATTGDAAAHALAASPAAARLRRLELETCGLTDAGARALATSPHLASLISLELAGDPIGDAASVLVAERRRTRYRPAGVTFPAEVLAPLPKNKIMAIKEYRALTNAGLAEAKLAVERIDESLGHFAPRRALTRWV